MKKNVLLGILFSFLTIASFSQGSITGVINDAQTGEEIIGANVIIVDSDPMIGTITDFSGNFFLDNVPAGTHTIQVSFISYDSKRVESVTINDGETKNLTIKLEKASVDINEVKVKAKSSRESEKYQLMEQKKSTVIKESIGVKELSKMGVSDAESATTKISGVTKTESSGDVYIRGLGDRYLTTTMNGLPIPSDDVSKKNIDLKLFSTDIISNVGISKTYSVERYADQASGNVDISSKTIGYGITVDVSTGINSNILSFDKFSEFKASRNYEDLTLGYYNKPYDTKEAVKQQSWNTVEKNIPLDYGLSVLGGKEFELGNGNKLSFFGTLSHSGESEYRKGVYRRYESNYHDREFTDAVDYITNIETSGLLNLSYNFSANSSISYNALYINKTEDELYEAGRNGSGYYFEATGGNIQVDGGDSSIYIKDQNIITTQVLINQLQGSHKIGDKNKLNWAVTYNLVNADEPNRIRNVVSILDESVYYVRQGGFDQKKSSQSIQDNDITGYVRDEFSIIDEDNKKLKLNIGANFRNKKRDFENKFIGIEVHNEVRGSAIDNMDEVLLDQNLYNTYYGRDNDEPGLKLNEQPPDVYNAELLVFGGYADIEWGISNFSGNLGLRYEHDYLFIEWDVSNDLPGEEEPSYDNILPALNLKYQLTDKSSLRFAASKTITLPEFKEIAPFEYVSPEGDVTKGNPELKMSQVYNVDLKWELFPSMGELISAAAFYKMINDPINLTIKKGSSQIFYYENTGEQAQVYGIELEGKVNVLKSASRAHKLNLSMNATKMWFNQDIIKDFQYNNKTEIGLQGAADFITNTSLSYRHISERPFTATLTGNYSSDKIFALGASEDVLQSDVLFNNEIIEKGFVTLDFVLSKQISDRISVKFSAKNLADPSIERIQEIELPGEEAFDAVVRSYKKGRSFSLGISIDINN